MGHKGISITVRFSHPAPKHTLAAVERLAEVGSEAPTDSKTSTGASEQAQLEPTYVQ